MREKILAPSKTVHWHGNLCSLRFCLYTCNQLKVALQLFVMAQTALKGSCSQMLMHKIIISKYHQSCLAVSHLSMFVCAIQTLYITCTYACMVLPNFSECSGESGKMVLWSQNLFFGVIYLWNLTILGAVDNVSFVW